MKKLVSSLAPILMLFVGDASGATLIDANFDDLATGAITFTSPVAGQFPVNTPNTARGSTGAGATATVTAATGGNTLVLSKTTTGTTLYVPFTLNPTDAVTTGIVTIEFDLKINIASNGNFFIHGLNNDNKSISSLILASTGGLKLYGLSAGTGSSSVETGTNAAYSGTLSTGADYHIRQIYNFDTGMLDVSVIGATTQTISQQFAVNTYGISGIGFSSASASSTGEWTIDNLTMTAIPEPGSMLLLGFGALSLMAGKRIRQKLQSLAQFKKVYR